MSAEKRKVRVTSTKRPDGPEGGWYWDWEVWDAETGKRLDKENGTFGTKRAGIEAGTRFAEAPYRGWEVVK